MFLFFCPLRGIVIIIEKAQSWQRGMHLYALMGHLALYIYRALLATTEPGNCPCESCFAPDGAQL